MLLVMISPVYGTTLTLQECLDKALHSHPDIQRFVLQLRYSQKDVEVARADYLPQITLSGEYDPTRTYVFPANGVFSTRDDDGWQVGAMLKQKIWDFGKTTDLIKAREVQQEIAGLSLQDAKALLVYKVKIQYDLAVIQREAMAVRQEDFRVKDALYKQAKALFAQGLKTRADASRFLSSRAAADDNLSIARANFDQAVTLLSLYIGAPIDKNVELEKNLLQPGSYSVDEQSVMVASPVLKRLQKAMDKTEYLYRATRAGRFGSIDAVASYTHQDTLNAYDATLVGVMLNIPLYSGGRLSAQQEQADIDRQSAKNDYAAKLLTLKEEYATLRLNLRRYSQTIQARTAQLQAARETKEVVDGRYREGLSTYIEVLDATAAMLEARLGLLQARYDQSSTIHRMEYLQGKTL